MPEKEKQDKPIFNLLLNNNDHGMDVSIIIVI
jgi:hypothetical protein